MHCERQNGRLVRARGRFWVCAAATSSSRAPTSISFSAGRTLRKERASRSLATRALTAPNVAHARACVAFGLLTIFVPTVLVRHHRYNEGRLGEGHRGRQDDGPDGLLQAREAHDLEDKQAYRLRAGAGGHGRGRLAQGGGAAAHAKCLPARSAPWRGL